MYRRSKHRRWILSFVIIIMALTIVTPVLAQYIGPNRTVTETTTSCKVVLYECQFVTEKDEWKYKQENSWSCSSESKPWQAYSSNKRPCNDTLHTNGYQYWEREDVSHTETNTYPPATISGILQSCTLQNGWCITPPQVSLSGVEPVPGYNIFAVEGTLNGQSFACTNGNCNVPLIQGNNNLNYWALSSFGDSSSMGTLTAKVDSQLPTITASLSGTPGSNGWYLSSVTLNNSASDATSGLASFTCTRDGATLGFCNTIAVNGDGPHTVVLTARDNAGHTRVLTQNTSIDTQNPALNASVNGTVGSNTWYTAAVLNASASDPSPGSGLSVLQYNLDGGGWTAFPISGALNLSEGKHSVDLRAIDKAGRSVSSSKSYWLDTTAPGLSLDASGTFGLNNWYVTSPTLSAFASDDTSGLDLLEYTLDGSTWTAYTTPLNLSDGIHNISVWAQDQAGSVTQVDRTYQVDTRTPQIAGSLSGTPGMNGWYTSDVTVSASASDPQPGSDIDTFTYFLDGGAESSYTDALILSDGQHALQLIARDRAGLSYALDQTFKVDTLPPSITIDTALPNWINGTITLNGSAGDNGSGLASVELSTDGGQTWQAVTGTNAWSYVWNTSSSPNGVREVHVRALDQAGLTAEQTLSAAVDNQSPAISLPDSWLQWDSVMLNILDEHSGLSEARVEISDPQGRWPTRVISLDPGQFPLALKWDRRFADGTIAEAGTYDVKVFASDALGNTATKNAAIQVLLDILPPGPASTLAPTSIVSINTATPIPARTAAPSYTATNTLPTPTPRATESAIVVAFGTMEPRAQASPTQTFIPSLRATPTQSTSVDLLQAIFAPETNEQSTTEVITTQDSPLPVSTNNSVLWGTAATAAIAAATAYVQEEKRKRDEEKARQKALEEAEEERREKLQERKVAKMEAQRAQEEAWEQARLEETRDSSPIHTDIKIARMEYEEGVLSNIKNSPPVTKPAATKLSSQDRRAERKDELAQEALNFYSAKPQQDWKADYDIYMAQKAREEAAKKEQELPESEPSWWEKTKTFINENIVQPANTYIYKPIIKPTIEKIAETAENTVTWLDKNIYQPYIQPAVEKSKLFITSEVAQINEKIVVPYLKPVADKASEAVAKSIEWLNEKVYQPHIKPAVEKTIQNVSKVVEWMDKEIYEPYIQPAVEVINEELYQPYIKPIVEEVNQSVMKAATWVDEKIYQPYFEPVVRDINQYVYQPLVNKVSNWWDQYGEWVHGALDAVGFIPGLGEVADGLNGLIYLGEGRYLDASLSVMAMIPLIGDLGKAGKWTLKAGQEIVETAVTKVVKEVAEEAVEKVTKELLEEGTEKILKESGEELIEEFVKEAGEELVEKVAKETLEESAEKVIKEAGEEAVVAVSEKVTKEVAEEVSSSVPKGTFIEEIIEETPKHIDKGPLIKSLKEQYGDEVLDVIQRYDDNGILLLNQYGSEAIDFVKRAEKLGVDPTDVLDHPPRPGQSLEGWLLKIDDPNSPVNLPADLKLSTTDVKHLLNESVHNTHSSEFVLGYFDPNKVSGYIEVAENRTAIHLKMEQSLYNQVGFKNGTGDFWQINRAAIQYGLDKRKIFVLSTDLQTILSNPSKFTYAEIQMILHPGNNYVHIYKDGYDMLVPAELLIP
jgi:hypothetical protein